MTKTLEGNVLTLKQKQLDVALKAANELFEFVNKYPLLKYEIYQNKQCYLYVASLYKVAAITTYAW